MSTVAAFNTPTGTIAPMFDGTKYAAPFNVTATFTPSTPGGSCADLFYRQYVSGSFWIDGIRVTHILCQETGAVLDQNAMLEDGCPPENGSCDECTAYGYRECPSDYDYYYDPDQETGAEFWMYDAPGFSVVQPGTTYALSLSFSGQIQNAGGVITQSNWNVEGVFAVPDHEPTTQTTETTIASDSPPDAKPLALKSAVNANGDQVIVLSLSQGSGGAKLKPSVIQLKLYDTLGREVEVGPPAAHEIATPRGRATAHLLYPKLGSARPVKGLVLIAGVGHELHVQTD